MCNLQYRMDCLQAKLCAPAHSVVINIDLSQAPHHFQLITRPICLITLVFFSSCLQDFGVQGVEDQGKSFVSRTYGKRKAVCDFQRLANVQAQ